MWHPDCAYGGGGDDGLDDNAEPGDDTSNKSRTIKALFLIWPTGWWEFSREETCTGVQLNSKLQTLCSKRSVGYNTCFFLIKHGQFLTKYPVYIVEHIVTQTLSTINQTLEATQYHKITTKCFNHNGCPPFFHLATQLFCMCSPDFTYIHTFCTLRFALPRSSSVHFKRKCSHNKLFLEELMFYQITVNSNTAVRLRHYLKAFNTFHVKAFELTNNVLTKERKSKFRLLNLKN